MRRYLPHIALGLFLVQLLLMLVSWLLAAAFPVSGFRSLLSSEGLRWLMGHFADVLATPLLVYIVLLSMACGVAFRSWRRDGTRGYHRERSARIITLLLFAAIVGVVVLLTVVPHALLLSATGSLWPSPFSRSLVPVVAFSVTLLAGVYGVVSDRLHSLSDLYESLLQGLRMGASWLLFYVLVMQIYESLRFVLSANPHF